MTKGFRDRADAGQQLAVRLNDYAHGSDVVVVGLPQGGIPVAMEVSNALQIPLEICLVRKLCLPGHKHQMVTFGAIDSEGDRLLNYEVIQQWAIPDKTIDKIAERELRDLQRRERAYHLDRPVLALRDRTLIVVDDGLATGSTMQAAVALLKQQHPQSLLVAVPVAPKTVCDQLSTEVDQVICLCHPDPFYNIALSYDNYAPLTEAEILQLLTQTSDSSVDKR